MATAQPSRSSPWLHGPASDLLLGGGLVYVPIFLVLLGAGATLQKALPMGLLPIVALAFSTPHLGATLLRVYDREQDRRAYALFAFWATALLAVAFLVGLYVPIVGSVLITIYLTVVPWHFTGQNYGIALVFLRRRGIEVTPEAKRWIYLTFVLTYAMTVFSLHGVVLSESYAPLETSGTVYRFLSLGIPAPIQAYGIVLLGLAYLFCLGSAISALLEAAPVRALLPASSLVLTQALWYAVPILIHFVIPPESLGPFAPANHGYTFFWVSCVHGAQYLWITTYYAARQQPPIGQTAFLGRSLLAGAALYGFPILLLAPGVLGRLPFDSGLFLMVAGALNVHHVLLDSAIWKLRDGRIARILLRSEEESGAPPVQPERSWLRPVIWASGAVGVALIVLGSLETEFGFQRAVDRGDLPRLETAARRLTWMGRNSASLQSHLGTLRAAHGDSEGALTALQESVDLLPTATAWLNIGALKENAGDVRGALAAYESALELAPDDPTSLHYAGRAALKLGRLGEAREWLGRAAALAPDDPEIRRTWQRAGSAKASLGAANGERRLQ